MTVCRIRRNDAEKRVKEMEKNKWKSSLAITTSRIQNWGQILLQLSIFFPDKVKPYLP